MSFSKTKRKFLSVSIGAFVAAAVSMPTLAQKVPTPITPASLAGAKVIDAKEAKKIQDAGGVLYDTRIKSEFSERTLAGAISLPYGEKSTHAIDFDSSLDKLDLAKLPENKNTAVVFFCNGPACWKSYKASVLAMKAGHKNVYWFREGMPQWAKEGLPIK